MKRSGSALVYVLVTAAVAGALLTAGLAGMIGASRQRQAFDDAGAAKSAAMAGLAQALDTTGSGAVEYGIRSGTGALLPVTLGSAAGTCAGFTLSSGWNTGCETTSATLRSLVAFNGGGAIGPVYYTTRDFVSGAPRTLTFYATDGVSRPTGQIELVAESGFTVSAAAGTGYAVAPTASGVVITILADVSNPPVAVPVTVTYSPLLPAHGRAFRVQRIGVDPSIKLWVTSLVTSVESVGTTPSGATSKIIHHRYPADRATPSAAAPATPVVITRIAPSYSFDAETGRCSGVAGSSLLAADLCPYGE